MNSTLPNGATAQRRNGATAQRRNGATAQRRNGATAQRRNGATAQRRPRRRAFLVLVLIFIAAIFAPRPAQADGLPYTFSRVDAFDGPEYHLTLGPNPALYFVFQHSENLLLQWSNFNLAADIAFGISGPTFVDPPTATVLRRFYRARGISISSPEDQDNDGMDDVWELQHPYLNALNPNDANFFSTETDHLAGETNLEYYRRKRGIVPLKQVYTREVAVFNFGAAISNGESISRSISLFNGLSLPTSDLHEVYSREVASFNFGSPLASFEAVSREATVFNFGSPLAQVEAVSRAVSIFNGPSVPDGTPEVYSREVSAFNFGAPTAGVEAISREISVNNTQ